MTNIILETIVKESGKKAVVLDGGFATQLERIGKDLSQDHLWSARVLADDPTAVQQVHSAFYEAGADIATTASYQASFDGFERAGFGKADAEALLRRSVQLADASREAFWSAHQAWLETLLGHDLEGWLTQRQRPLVAFSAGPYGAALADGSEYDGSYAERVTEEQLMDFHRQRLQAIAGQPGVDLIAFETVPCLKELRAISRLLRTESFGVPAWVSCSARSGTAISHGEDLIGECLPVMCEAESVVAVGVNCLPPHLVAPIMKGMATAVQQTGLPRKSLLVYPNSGEEWDAAARDWKGESVLEVENFGRNARIWADAGATVIGGCCRTTPEHIRSVASHLAI
ncbi:g10700 [Coccomyxa elongata]